MPYWSSLSTGIGLVIRRRCSCYIDATWAFWICTVNSKQWCHRHVSPLATSLLAISDHQLSPTMQKPLTHSPGWLSVPPPMLLKNPPRVRVYTWPHTFLSNIGNRHFFSDNSTLILRSLTGLVNIQPNLSVIPSIKTLITLTTTTQKSRWYISEHNPRYDILATLLRCSNVFFFLQVSKLIGAASEADWSPDAIFKPGQAVTGLIASIACSLPLPRSRTPRILHYIAQNRRNWPRPSKRTRR